MSFANRSRSRDDCAYAGRFLWLASPIQRCVQAGSRVALALLDSPRHIRTTPGILFRTCHRNQSGPRSLADNSH